MGPLDSHDELRQERLRRGWSRPELAVRLQRWEYEHGSGRELAVDRNALYRWETGRRGVSEFYAIRLEAVLGIPRGRFIDRRSRRRAGRLDAATGQEEANLDRRGFSRAVGAAIAAALVPPGALGGDGRRVDRRLVAAHEEVAEALAGLYRGADPHAALPAAVAYADDVLGLLHAPMGDRERADLAALVVGVHAQVGLWACHVGRWPLAHRYLATACDVAAGTGDRPLHARSLGALSYLFSSAPRGGRGGDPARALSLLDDALELAARADGFTRGWLATWRADQHATLGELTAALAGVGTAERGLDAADDGGVQGFFSRATYGYGMRGHLDSVRAVVLALHGELEASDRTFQAVQASAANCRRRVASYGHLALVRANAHEPEAACDALDRSITLAAQEGYTMGLQRACGVRAGFEPAWSGLACVRELDERLRRLTG